ncbi:MAG: thioredoxin family protein [Cycloclasticus sp.]|nr:MAG: thioredoxin family protein [Cycloclasticus sp.]
MIELTFYTTDRCHLCEEAKSLLQQLLAKAPESYQIEIIDISDSDALIEQYGTRIPVIKKSTDNDDLGWPFEFASLLAYVESN